jgi:3-hydroxy-9,10-secoandrosta-1,3,5(10)-triene-9,17-dione monooxygenase reductase component
MQLSVDPVDSKTLRSVLGQYPSGVTVVTAVRRGEPVGFACQSFHSLSLDPPMIVVLAGRSSATWPKIREVRRFCVNVLAEGQEEVCRAFSVSGADKFAGVEWEPGPTGSPVLAGSSAWVDCHLVDEYDGGDHTIAVGRVHAVGSDETSSPLIFHRGLFRALAD